MEPMLLQRKERLPEGPEWLYEIKLDGYRALGIKSAGRVQIRSRNNNDFTSRYRPIADALAGLPDETVVDGEIVALDDKGRPSFNHLQNYSSQVSILFYVFDILMLSGRDVCIELKARFLATNELRLQFHLEGHPEHQVCVQIPAPLSDPKALLTLLRLEMEQRPPSAPILKLQLELVPAAPKTTQEELFTPAYPAPEQIELSLARVRRIVGSENVGRPELLDTHRPDGFVMRPFVAAAQRRTELTGSASLAFRRYRPPEPANVQVQQRPVHVYSRLIRGPVRIAWGPWYANGDW